MKRLGISVYPEKATLKENKDYIKLAHKYGFKRVFTCLLSVDGNKDEVVSNFKEVISYANSLDMEVLADVSPRIFNELDISYKDLSFFDELGVWGIRLDMGFGGNEESLMTFNEYNINIEINMSNDTHYIDTIMDYCPNKDRLVGSHNFYPHRYSGLELEHFRSCTKKFKSYGLEVGAFIDSKVASFGPWPVDEGLCTLERHRELDIELQALELFREGIDTVIISNCFASEEELKLLSKLNRDLIEFEVESTIDHLDEIEKNIIFDMLHFNRGDVNENMIRSTQSRVKYKGHEFVVKNPKDIEKGDIIIESSQYGHYAGELQIAKKAMKNSGKTSIVGHINPKYYYLLDQLKAWEKFRLKAKEDI